jgi:hypothetical protein
MCLLVLAEMVAEPHSIARVVMETKFCSRFEDDELRFYKIIEGSTKCCVCFTSNPKKVVLISECLESKVFAYCIKAIFKSRIFDIRS